VNVFVKKKLQNQYGDLKGELRPTAGNEELNNFVCSLNIIKMLKSRTKNVGHEHTWVQEEYKTTVQNFKVK
jgi:hypothetical protein